jgi:hypothetical protein
MAEINADELAKVDSFPKLVKLLRDKLDWPIDEGYEFDDVTFEYEPKDLGLKPEEAAKVREIHQLRPLVTGQPWGIFFLSFDEKAMSVTVLRRVLRELVVKQRASGQSATQAAWQKEDLIFVAGFGSSGERELAFVHFCDNASTGDLPVMKVLGWSAKDTTLHNRNAGQMLSQRLVWPDDDSDLKSWRDRWASAFEIAHREVITTSRDLAIRLAALASEIRARANQLLEAETDQGPMQTMLAAFRKNIIHDLDEDGFADMFAQTIAYGLLAARISRPMGIIADNLADMVPKTNPFLKELFGNFLKIGGREKRAGLDFDELGVRDVVDVLNKANMEAVLRDFGDRNPKEDPVIHFYELFLKEYDSDLRKQLGVYYTPRPVVNFIVRGVDEILRTEFGLPLGLADTSTWAEVAARNDRITIPAHVKPDAPFVQILDPATGTGTFLVEAIDLIHKRMEGHWKAQGKSAADIRVAWNAYVPAHLLPRLTAFELMMAPYTIAHMKVGLKLMETGYAFGSDERARIFLTNALAPARDLDFEFMFMSEALAHEAQASNEAKANTPFTVVIGNPPYSNFGQSNKNNFIQHLLKDFKAGLGEKKLNLDDDFIKFFRASLHFTAASKYYVISLITNSTFIGGITHRKMREFIVESSNKIQIIDLFGGIKRNTGESSGDENVFAITIDVAISTIARTMDFGSKTVSYLPLKGSRAHKYDLLSKQITDQDFVQIVPSTPNFFLEPRKGTDEIYISWNSVSEVFGLLRNGIQTDRDDLFIDEDKFALESRMKTLLSGGLTKSFMHEFRVMNSSSYRIEERIEKAVFSLDSIRKVSYRPFDYRNVYYELGLTSRPAYDVMQHLLQAELSMLVSRQQGALGFQHVLCAEGIVERCSISLKSRECSYVMPLWLKPSAGEPYRRPNIDRNWAQEFGKTVSLAYEDGIPGGGQKSSGSDVSSQNAIALGPQDSRWDGRGDLEMYFGPRDLFDYIYAVLHSPGYRSRYAEFLMSDFPRIPKPKTHAGFIGLVALGQQLVALHLLRPNDALILKSPEIRFAGNGEARVEKGYPEYKNGKVMINASRWFEDVPKATWEFHVGGYQVCEKWLKDRAAKGGKKPSEGRVLTEEDILHYRRVVVSLTETRRLMAEIDIEIEKHGGWPGAFVVGE